MAAAITNARHEWHLFRHDTPGERFRNHRDRMQKKSKKHVAVSMALGVLLLAVGVVLLFLPGPGTPLIVFGVWLIASHSAVLSKRLDRAEPVLRQRGHQLAHWWKTLPRVHTVGVISGGVLLFTAGMLAIWKWVVVAYLL